MRVYVPSTTTMLRGLLDTGRLAPADQPVAAFAVTPGLRSWVGPGNGTDAELDEELEYAALSEAARGSLWLLDADPSASRRRAVLAVEVPDGAVDIRDDPDPGAVTVRAPIVLAAIAAVHLDDATAEETMAAAADEIESADEGDEESIDRVADADAFELSWYATQELAAVLDGV